MVVRVFFLHILVDIVPLLILITASKNDTAVLEYSCVKLTFGEFCQHFIEDSKVYIV